MLRIKNLTVELGPAHAAKKLLAGIDLTVGAGEAVGLVGESGSGKSMTMRSVLRTLPHGARATGSIEYGGNGQAQDLFALRPEQLRRFRAASVSMISQNPQAALNPVLPVKKFLVEGVQAAKPGTSAQAALQASRDMLAQVGIHDVDRCLDSYPHQLSGGMLQRIVIAGSVVRGSELLLADEPTTALDVTTQSEVMAILDEARTQAGMAMLFVTHDLDLAAAVCDRIAVMAQGRIVESGTADQVLARPAHEYTQMLVASKPSLDRRIPAAGRGPGTEARP